MDISVVVKIALNIKHDLKRSMNKTTIINYQYIKYYLVIYTSDVTHNYGVINFESICYDTDKLYGNFKNMFFLKKFFIFYVFWQIYILSYIKK